MSKQRFIFFLLLLVFPLQLGKHFWPDFAYVLGQQVDYLSPTVYLADIFIGLLFFLSLPQIYQFFKNYFCFILCAFLSVIFISLFWIYFQKENPFLLIYKWFKFFELLFFASWVSKNVKMREIIFPLNLGVFWESILAWLEFFYRRSLNLWLLGERSFDLRTPGIALAQFQNKLFLRPYATFPHPNVLAGYFLVVLTLNLFSQKKLNLFDRLVVFLASLTIFICFSRTAWLVWLLIIFLYWFMKKRKNELA